MPEVLNDAASAHPATVAIVGYLSLDTLALADGRRVEAAGGAALYAALGALKAGARPCIHARLGCDFPHAVVENIARLGIDIDGLVPSEEPSRGAILTYEVDGRRSSPHHRDDVWWQRTHRLAPPRPRHSADAVVLCPMPMALMKQMLEDLAASAVCCVVDTSEAFVACNRSEFLQVIRPATLFCPSVAETRLLFPDLDDEAALVELTRHVSTVVQKRGERGLALARPAMRPLQVAARSTAVVDPTGAGDAAVGALAAGLARGLPDRALLELAVEVAAMAVSGVATRGLGL